MLTLSDINNNILLNSLNGYRNSEQIYPLDWNKWKVGNNGYPVFE